MSVEAARADTDGAGFGRLLKLEPPELEEEFWEGQIRTHITRLVSTAHT